MGLQNEKDFSGRLEKTLRESKEYARRGYKLSKEAVKLLRDTISSASLKIKENITSLENSNIDERSVINGLTGQLQSIKENFDKMPQKLDIDLKSLSKSSFSITLFGRTMAGKSTMMEILTHGNGQSIGKGAQRTTRDVRIYKYRDMTVTDVPGIAAFEGEDDEKVAFEAAKKSDLILFLLTDDAPQASEAECLNKILRLGKPVICIINVKVNIDISTNFKMFNRDIEKKMKIERMDAIRKQFVEFGVQFGENWNNLRFIYVHLKSAYLAQQDEWKEHSLELKRMSRFEVLENAIIDEVIKNGKFYRLKSFVDVVIVPILDAFETLFKQSSENSEQGRILVSKEKKLQQWKDEFEMDSKRRIDAFVVNLISELKKEVTSFAEDNYDNSRADVKWKEVLETHNIESRATDLLHELANECENELQEICREIKSELKFSHIIFSDKSIKMPFLIDGKRVWNWATSLTSGGLMIASLFVSGPIGWIGAGVGVLGWLGSFLFKDRDKKIRDARRKLEDRLSDNLDKLGEELNKKMKKVLLDDIIKKQLGETTETLREMVNSMFVLSDIQFQLAKELNYKLSEMNQAVLIEALKYCDYSGLEQYITDVVRIPGNAMFIMLEDGTRFPDDARRALSHLLKEQVWFIFNTNNTKSILSQAIGRRCNRENIHIQYIDNQPRIAHISNIDELDANTKNRIRLAQQLTELLVMR